MASCKDFDLLIAERASGPLSPADATRLDAHLAGCERCRAELAAFERALGFARLPPPTEAERRSLAHLPVRIQAEVRGAHFGKVLGRLLFLGAVAAGLVVVVANRFIIPGASHRTDAPATAAAPVEGWVEPDPDELVARVVKEHAELAAASEVELSRAETIADQAYWKAMAGE